MKYRHICTGQVVHSDNPELPRAFYEPLEEAQDAPEAPEAEAEEAGADAPDIDGMTKAELAELAESEGVDVPAKATKAQLIAAIKGE